jgi:protein tyrosine kinase modulator
MVIGPMALGVLIAVGTTYLVKPIYIAKGQLVVLRNPTEILSLAEYRPDNTDNLELKTQLDIMRSDRVVQRAAERLGIARDPNVRAAYEAAHTDATIEQYSADTLKKGLTILPAKDSRVVTIMYENNDPVVSANRANAVMDAFQDINSQLVKRTEMQSAEDLGRRIGVTNLSNLATDLEAARVELSRARSQYAAQSKHETNAPAALDSPALQALRLEESRAQAELKSTANHLGTNHPDYEERLNRLHSIRGEIETETRRIVAGLAVGVQAAEKRYEDAKLKFEAQRRILLGGSVARQTDASDPAAADHDEDSVAASPGNMEVSSGGATANKKEATFGVMILQRAEPPYQSNVARIRTLGSIGAILGLIVGIVGAAFREMGDLRIRTTDDIERWLDVPSLAAIPVCYQKGSWSNIKALAPPKTIALTDNRASGDQPTHPG